MLNSTKLSATILLVLTVCAFSAPESFAWRRVRARAAAAALKDPAEAGKQHRANAAERAHQIKELQTSRELARAKAAANSSKTVKEAASKGKRAKLRHKFANYQKRP